MKKFPLLFFLIVVCFVPSIYALEVLHFNQLQQPSSFNEQEVSIRGFLYSCQDEVVLAAEPNLKSCCVGNLQKLETQIFVKGISKEDVNSLGAVLIVGTFKVNSNNYKIIENARIIKETKNDQFLIMFSVGFLIISYMFYMIYRQFQQRAS